MPHQTRQDSKYRRGNSEDASSYRRPLPPPPERWPPRTPPLRRREREVRTINAVNEYRIRGKKYLKALKLTPLLQGEKEKEKGGI